MSGNRSLDEFGPAAPTETTEDPSSGDEAGDSSADVTEVGSPSSSATQQRDRGDGVGSSAEVDASSAPPGEQESSEPDEAVSPIRTTYEWRPDGAECAQCGETVSVRWRNEDGLVCEACKDW